MARRAGMLEWPPEMRECAKDVYISWPGDKRHAMAACVKILKKKFKKVPTFVSLYRWANIYGWEEERQIRLKASIVDATVEGMVMNKPADKVDPNELMGFLTQIIRDELDEGSLDNEGLRRIQDKIDQVLSADNVKPYDLANLARAFADTTRAKGTRGTLAARVLQAFATALDAIAKREEAMARAEADGHVCPALTGGAINPQCPLMIVGEKDENTS